MLDNALKYGGQGAIAVGIDLIADQSGPDADGTTGVTSRTGIRLAATIRDHGPGIAADQRERVFERFTRLQAGGGDGTGLGLSVARGLAIGTGATSRSSTHRMAGRAPRSSSPCKLNGSRKPDPSFIDGRSPRPTPSARPCDGQ